MVPCILLASAGMLCINPCFRRVVLSHLQQELSYRFVKDQTMAATGGSSTAASTSAGSHTSKVPTGELGSSLSSAFQKKVCNVCVCVCVRVCVHACLLAYGCVSWLKRVRMVYVHTYT